MFCNKMGSISSRDINPLAKDQMIKDAVVKTVIEMRALEIELETDTRVIDPSSPEDQAPVKRKIAKSKFKGATKLIIPYHHAGAKHWSLAQVILASRLLKAIPRTASTIKKEESSA